MARISLENLVLSNAAGMIKTRAETRRLLFSAVTRIKLGSFTVEPRAGNLGCTYSYDMKSGGALNAKGLGNMGLDALLKWLPGFQEVCIASGKELAVSVAGFTPKEYALLASSIDPFVDIIVINCGCGNIWDGGVQKSIPSYEPLLFREIMHCVGDAIGAKRKVAAKLSPVPNDILDDLSPIFDECPFIAEAIAVNTKPNQRRRWENGSEMLAFREEEGGELKHTGGLSGTPLKKEGLRVVRRLAELQPQLRIIGCGGIRTGQDLIDYMEAGAAGAAIGTGFFNEGPRIFSDVLSEAHALLDRV